ncbi:MAG: hypothetical protein JSW52_10515 [Candidatus Coatesbacteria bacterium]|nr:MAG: hypothetical protein JSW52_10515 [Candidatus Coatesbacteria bacterium]
MRHVAIAIFVSIVLTFGAAFGYACSSEEPCEACTGECAEEEIPACAECGSSENVIPIIYGYPGPELREAAERGEVFLGGCVMTGDDPLWYCKSCERRW